MYQLITEPTHQHGGTLDLLITSNTNSIKTTTVREPFSDTSDHHMIEFSIQTPLIKPQKKIPRYNYYKANYPQINNFLNTVNWDILYADNPDINTIYSQTLQIIHTAIETYVPKTTKRTKPYISPEVKKLLNQKLSTYKALKQNFSTKEEYKKVEKAYKNAVSRQSFKIEQQIASSGNKNLLYGYVNKKLNSKSIIPPLKSEHGELIVNPSLKVDLLNKTFQEIYSTDDGALPQLQEFEDISPMDWTVITTADVKCAIAKLKCSVSRTPDEVPAMFLKKCTTNLVYPLTKLFNYSLIERKLPSLWKEAIVTPIHKKGIKKKAACFQL